MWRKQALIPPVELITTHMICAFNFDYRLGTTKIEPSGTSCLSMSVLERNLKKVLNNQSTQADVEAEA